ncbi:MAG: acyl-CoA thioesterase, partial [Muribaculaceae bacterium]|nr:acyl-CoA thioesterase [Muribaculaceae bacterium]
SEGIVNNAIYLHYLEHTRHEFCEMAGFTFRSMGEQGLVPVARRVLIDYITPLTMGETMISKLALRRSGPRFIFQQDIFNAHGQFVVKAEVTIVCLRNGKPTRGDELANAFAAYL